MKKGFTLVELSIVLVIIGLLIGGILVGQSLVDNAKVKRLISNFQQLEIAVVQFKSRFKQIPGDADIGFPNPGNNDGDTFDPNSGAATAIESVNAFQHLQLGGFIDYGLDFSSGLPASNQDYVTGNVMPTFGTNKGGVMLSSQVTYSISGCLVGISLGASGGSYTAPNHTYLTWRYADPESLTNQDAYIIDKKTDDGLPRNGFLVGFGWGTGSCGTSTDYDTRTDKGCVVTWCLDKKL